MLHPFAAAAGIISVALAILVMARAVKVHDLFRILKRGLAAIVSFVITGAIVQMLFPGMFTASFIAGVRSLLITGIVIAVVVFALILLAKKLVSRGSDH